MAHAGTMMGGSAQTKQGGSPWPAIALTIAVIVATVAGVWLASSAGLVRGTAKPAAGQAYDQYLNSVLDRAHAAPYVAVRVTPSTVPAWPATAVSQRHPRPGACRAVRRRLAARCRMTQPYLNAILDRAHATPYSTARSLSRTERLPQRHPRPGACNAVRRGPGAARLPLIVGSSPCIPARKPTSCWP